MNCFFFITENNFRHRIIFLKFSRKLLPCTDTISEREIPKHLRICSINFGFDIKIFFKNILKPPGLKPTAYAQNPISMPLRIYCPNFIQCN